jgi:hypothetical protein
MKFYPVVLVLLLAACTDPIKDKQDVVTQSKMPEQGCLVETSSKLVNQRQVSEIFNLVQDKVATGYENRCTVRFDIKVDGQIYHLTETETGLEQMASICYYARERAREDLLLDLGGEFRSEATTLCRQLDK